MFRLTGHSAHPYMPNSVSDVKQEMLKEIGVENSEELYAQIIPDRLRLKHRMNLPKPLAAEAYSNPELVKTAHHNSSIARIPDANLEDPAKLAMTWRAYLRKRTLTK